MFIVPGAFVRHPGQPELGMGRVQTVVGEIITVNFEDAGKLIINGDRIELVLTDPVHGE